MKKTKRVYKHARVRKNVVGTIARPRLCVYRSTQHIYAQIINDAVGKTLVSESDLKVEKGSKSDRASQVGAALAKKALAKKITRVVFDRGGFGYQGRVKVLADAARKAGLEF